MYHVGGPGLLPIPVNLALPCKARQVKLQPHKSDPDVMPRTQNI